MALLKSKACFSASSSAARWVSCFDALQPAEAAKLGASQLLQPLTQDDGLPSGFLEDLAAKLEPEDLTSLLEKLSKHSALPIV